MGKRDYYEVLGVDGGSGARLKAYRGCCQYHPDMNPDNKEEAKRSSRKSMRPMSLGTRKSGDSMTNWPCGL